MKNNFSAPAFLWPLLTLVCITIILYGLNIALRASGWEKSKQKSITAGTIVIMLVWIGLITFLSCRGFFADFNKLPPRPGLAILLPLPFILLISFSKKGTTLLVSVPPHWFVFMQSFRILVELFLWFAFLANKLPVQMTFEGRNFDVLTGILALPVGYISLRKKSYASKLAVAYNILGIILLLNILIIAILSMPVSFRYFMNEPSNVLVAQFPEILLPAVLVPIAYSMHIFSLRKLFLNRKDKLYDAAYKPSGYSPV